MSDLINRQDAIDALTEANLKRHMDSVEDGQENRSAIRIIMELPSAEHHKLNIAEYIHDQYPDVWKHAEKELEVPSAERTGKWIRHTRVEPVYSIDGVKTWGIKCQCNQCGFATTVVEDFGYYKYCPNCGARMEGAEE